MKGRKASSGAEHDFEKNTLEFINMFPKYDPNMTNETCRALQIRSQHIQSKIFFLNEKCHKMTLKSSIGIDSISQHLYLKTLAIYMVKF